MAKQQTESKSEGPSAELLLNAILLVAAGEGGPDGGAAAAEIKEGHSLWTPALERVRELRTGYVDAENRGTQRGEQLTAIMSAMLGGVDDSGIKKGDVAWTDALDLVRDLKAKYAALNRLNDDLSKKLAEVIKRSASMPLKAERLSTESGFIILPDGQRINTRVIASYHATGIGEIEFKTSDGKTLGVYSAPLNNEQGSILPARRKEIRDQVIAQLDKLVDAMD